MLFESSKATLSSNKSQVKLKYSIFIFLKLLFLIFFKKKKDYMFLIYNVVSLNEVVSTSIPQIAVIVNYLPMRVNLF